MTVGLRGQEAGTGTIAGIKGEGEVNQLWGVRQGLSPDRFRSIGFVRTLDNRDCWPEYEVQL